MTMGQGDEAFDWSALVPRIVHPVQEAVIEALLYIGRPLSPADFQKLFDDPRLGMRHVSHHLNALSKRKTLVKTHKCRGRGAVERFYSLAKKTRRAKA
jgi:hypothetical protein